MGLKEHIARVQAESHKFKLKWKSSRCQKISKLEKWCARDIVKTLESGGQLESVTVEALIVLLKKHILRK